MPRTAFQIGDRVRFCVAACDAVTLLMVEVDLIGREGTIAESSKIDVTDRYRVVFGGDRSVWCAGKNLLLVTPAQQHRLKVGDRVMNYLRGTGTVQQVSPIDGWVAVDWDGGPKGHGWWDPDPLKLVPDVANVASQQPTFRELSFAKCDGQYYQILKHASPYVVLRDADDNLYALDEQDVEPCEG